MREREFASLPIELAQVNATGRTLTGYASAFNHPIESGMKQTTYVRPGAFTKTIKENLGQIQVLVNHGMDPRWGMSPVAVLKSAEEDSNGLRIEAPIIDDPSFDPLVASLKAGAFRSMSIQFEDLTAPDERFNEDRTERYIKEVRLWELGPVTFPANEGAVATLHSLAQIAVTANSDLQHQAEASSADGRGTEEAATPPVDDRLTRWLYEKGQTLERYAKEAAELEARLKHI